MKDFTRHEAIKNNLARIKKKRVPVMHGRAGMLPPLEAEMPRQGSAPTSADARGVAVLDAGQAQESDYYTVVARNSQSHTLEPAQDKAVVSRTAAGQAAAS